MNTATKGKQKVGGLVVNGTDITNELPKMSGQFDSVSMLAPTAAATVDAQFIFKDAGGNTLSHIDAGLMYLSTSSTGLTVNAATSVAAVTNGNLTTVVTGGIAQYVTTAAGLLGVRVVSGAETYYACFRKPNGGIAVSGPIVIT